MSDEISINKKMAKGAAWMVAFKLAQRSLTLVSMIVLARLLVPEDFGLVALATVFLAALEMMSAFSFDIALIHHKNPKRVHYNTVWTIQLLFSLSIGALLFLSAVPLSNFYAEPRLVYILMALSLGSILYGLENVGVVNFRKELEFDKEFIFLFSGRVVGFVVTITAAFLLRSYWALVLGITATKLTSLVASFVMSPYRPGLSLKAFNELFNYSKWLYINNLLQFLRHRSADFIIGKTAGPDALGTYVLAYEIAGIPTTEMVAPINRAVFPGYVKMASCIKKLRQGYLDVIGLIALLALPAAAGIAASSELIVLVLLGERWADAAPLISILGISGAIMAMESNIGSVYMALGKPRMIAILYGFYVAILVPMIVVMTSEYGAIGAAWACLITGIINIPVYYLAMFQTLHIKLRKFLAVVWRPITGSAIMYFAVRAVTSNIETELGSIEALPYLLGVILLGVVVYAALISIMWLASGKPDGAEQVALQESLSQLRKITKKV